MEKLLFKISTFKLLQSCLVIVLLISGSNAYGQFHKILIPHEIIVQHGGSIGFMSAGVGYPLFKNKRGTLDFNYGFIPEKRGGPLHIISAKFAYRPLEIKIIEGVKLFPANPGFFFSYHIGKQFDFYWDKDTYEEGYYWWSTALRPHLSLSTEVKLDALKILKTSLIKDISLYSEFNTNELYLTSYYKNSGTISFLEILKLGVGLRVHL
jgi:hypothetical protein